jgi:UDP-glucose 4-epimerase
MYSSALVTGASGFIGSALVRRLLDHKVDVTCLTRTRSLKTHERVLAPAKVVAVDSYQVEQLISAIGTAGPDIVYNLASYGVRQQDRDPELLIEGNVGLMGNLLRAAAYWRVHKFIHVGSCAEYGFPAVEGELISENQRLAPASTYGAAKASSTLYGAALANQLEVPFMTLRLFGVFGVGESEERIVPYLINCLRHDFAANLTPGDQTRDLLYISDVVDALLTACGSDSSTCEGVYNVCSAKAIRIRQLGTQVADALNKPYNLLHWGMRQYRKDEPMWLVGDNSRFVGETGWHPKVTVKEGINRMIDDSMHEGMRHHADAL